MNIYDLLSLLNSRKGSDILLAAYNCPTVRVNNVYHKIEDRLLTPEEIEGIVAPIIAPEKMEIFKQRKELDTSYQDETSRYRINLHYQRASIGATIRRIPKEIPTMDELQLPPIMKSFINFDRGIVLVTGPTGSGKSTTQAAMINQINLTRSCHIITIEDPIEFIHPPKLALIEQREVGIDTNSFADALSRSLRQMPDVILVGEMRDLESIQMAITSAETGHLVISTLHTQDAVQSIDRIIDAFPPHHQPQIRTQLSLTLQAIVSQQLIPRADGKGLIGAFEIMFATTGIRNIIRKGSTQDIYSMVELGGQYSMQTMDSALKELAKKGLISRNEALNYASNRERMEKSFGGAA
jgi:twitching motility protein PilT